MGGQCWSFGWRGARALSGSSDSGGRQGILLKRTGFWKAHGSSSTVSLAVWESGQGQGLVSSLHCQSEKVGVGCFIQHRHAGFPAAPGRGLVMWKRAWKSFYLADFT